MTSCPDLISKADQHIINVSYIWQNVIHTHSLFAQNHRQVVASFKPNGFLQNYAPVGWADLDPNPAAEDICATTGLLHSRTGTAAAEV